MKRKNFLEGGSNIESRGKMENLSETTGSKEKRAIYFLLKFENFSVQVRNAFFVLNSEENFQISFSKGRR